MPFLQHMKQNKLTWSGTLVNHSLILWRSIHAANLKGGQLDGRVCESQPESGPHRAARSNTLWSGEVQLARDGQGRAWREEISDCSVLVTTSKALVTSSDALVPSSFLLLNTIFSISDCIPLWYDICVEHAPLPHDFFPRDFCRTFF